MASHKENLRRTLDTLNNLRISNVDVNKPDPPPPSYLSRPLPVIEGQNNPSYGLQRKNMVQNKIYDSMIPAMTSSNHKSSTINDVVLPPPPNYLHSTQNQQQINRPPPPYKGSPHHNNSQSTQINNKPTYNVKLPKFTGKTEADKKYDLMLKQLEHEMDEKEKKENFGNCDACGKEVIGERQACQAMEKIYHSDCFVCCACGRSLKEKEFYNVNGTIYCEEDYLFSGFQQTAEKCSICGHLIMEMILQAMGNFYHPGCFRCCVCNECLDGVPFTVDFDNKIYCVNDFSKLFAPSCAACGEGITPFEGTTETVKVEALGKDFHVDCYVCEGCGMQLTDEPEKRCYPLNGRLLCYYCRIKISPNVSIYSPNTVQPTYYAERGTTEQVSLGYGSMKSSSNKDTI